MTARALVHAVVRPAAAVVLTGALALAVAGCDDDSSSQAATPSSSGSASGSPGDDTSTGTPSPPADPLASSSLAPVLRDGRTPRPTVSARPAPIDAPVRYGDGVRLSITSVRQGKVTGEGPGVVRGPKTTFALQMRNGSSRAIDLDQVVVTLEYGRPSRVARPVYDTSERDFAGTLRPGRSTSAVYSFSVPVDGRSAVTVHVDFDAVHTAAVFRGAAR